MSVGREGVFPIPCSWTLPTVAVCTREEFSHAFANGTRRGILLRVVSLNAAASAGSAGPAIQSHIIYDLLW